jgi:hypothetical protein
MLPLFGWFLITTHMYTRSNSMCQVTGPLLLKLYCTCDCPSVNTATLTTLEPNRAWGERWRGWQCRVGRLGCVLWFIELISLRARPLWTSQTRWPRHWWQRWDYSGHLPQRHSSCLWYDWSVPRWLESGWWGWGYGEVSTPREGRGLWERRLGDNSQTHFHPHPASFAVNRQANEGVHLRSPLSPPMIATSINPSGLIQAKQAGWVVWSRAFEVTVLPSHQQSWVMTVVKFDVTIVSW